MKTTALMAVCYFYVPSLSAKTYSLVQLQTLRSADLAWLRTRRQYVQTKMEDTPPIRRAKQFSSAQDPAFGGSAREPSWGLVQTPICLPFKISDPPMFVDVLPTIHCSRHTRHIV